MALRDIFKDRKTVSTVMTLPTMTMTDDQALAYGSDSFGYAAIDLIASSILRAEWFVKNVNTNQIALKKECPALYNMLESPNVFMPWSTLLDYEVKDLLTKGNAFMEIASSGAVKHPDIELHRLIPRYVTIIPDAKRYVKQYNYEINGNTIQLRPDSVVFMRLANPEDEFLGKGPLEIATKDIRLRGYTKVFLRSFFKNGAILSGILVTKQPISEEEFTKLERKLQGDFSGATNMFKLLLIDSNEIEKVDFGPKMQEIPFTELDTALQLSILATFRTPAALIGGEANATKASAVAIAGNFWGSVIVPYLNLIRDFINQRLMLYYPNFRIEYDISKVPEIQSFNADISEKLSRLVLSGVLLRDEAREWLGKPPLENNVGNKAFVPLNVGVAGEPNPGNNKAAPTDGILPPLGG